MSQVQALLSIDAGRVPPGAIAFFPRDPEAIHRRICGVMAILVEGGAFALFAAHVAGPAVPLLALIGFALTVGAFPTAPDPGSQTAKRPTLVLTQEGLIVRDAEGLRSWYFDDLADVRPYLHYRSVGLLVVSKNGKRDFIDTTFFERGDKVSELIGRRLNPREV
jgi:hypothetical protein